MSLINVNDIFDQLNDENKRLKECLKVLIEYKKFVDLVSNKLKTRLDSNDSQKFEELNQRTEHILKVNDLFNSLDIEDNDIKRETDESNDKTVAQSKTSNKYDSKRKEKVPWSKVNDVYVCGFVGCGKEYSAKSGFDYHLNTHIKRYVCDYEGCTYRTGIRKCFKQHLNVHKQVKPYQCTSCSQGFCSKRRLSIHMKSLHDCSDKPLICGVDKCKKIFDNQFRLSIHIKNIHLREKTFSCDYPNCDFRTTYRRYLINHQLIHSEERPFICDHEGCAMAFKTKYILSKHKATHLTDRPFKCSYEGCDKTFKRIKTLSQHKSSIHSGIKHGCNWPGCDFETNSINSLSNHKLVHSTERKFHCVWPQCGKSFKRKIHLTQHIRIHNNERRYICSWPGCNYRCVFDGNLNKHMRVHQK